jgi:CDP-diacylglycerol pyrophosphatase
LPENLVGQHYVGKRIRQDNLEGVYPFVQIGRQLAKSSVEMKNFGVAVVPVTFEDKQQGFVLLADEAGRVKNNTGHTENMLDFTCKGFVN